MRKLVLLVALLAAASCAKAKHIAVQVDVAYSTTLFAIDDAQWKACHPTPVDLTQAICDRLDPAIKHALEDGQALTRALQAAPRDGVVPQNLPDLLANLNSFQQILNEAKASPTVSNLASKVSMANSQLIALLKRLAGG